MHARSSAAPCEPSVAYSHMKEQFLAWYTALPQLHKAPIRAHLLRQGLLQSALPAAPLSLVPPAAQQMRGALQKLARRQLEACHAATLEHEARIADCRCVKL
jgi:hypothetical protein